MPMFRKKPITIEAHRWFQNGDHPKDNISNPQEREGELVRYFRRPVPQGIDHCKECGNFYTYHGWIDTKEGGHIVCPGDWIITGVKGEHYPCKPEIFSLTYEDPNEQHEMLPEQKQLLKMLNALRLEVDASIVESITEQTYKVFKALGNTEGQQP